MLPVHSKTTLAVVLCGATWSLCALAQVAPPTVLQIDTENHVRYLEDITDVSRFAADPNITTGTTQRNFGKFIVLGDIVAVNGQPAKGTLVFHVRSLTLRTAPNPGEAIADVVRGAVIDQIYEILKSDGTSIGTIMASGLGAGAAPPGAPLALTQGNNTIVGGTGAFLGARGQAGQVMTPTTVADRVASMAEDPANRRGRAGGRARFILHVIPHSVPQIAATASGPAIAHSNDFVLVTASRPAAASEILSLWITGLGPTRPGVNPGQPFPASPLAVVTSPVEVLVNGRSAEVLSAVGLPGAVDGYQVNFRVPPDTARGMATVQVSAAWIAGPAVSIPIQ